MMYISLANKATFFIVFAIVGKLSEVRTTGFNAVWALWFHVEIVLLPAHWQSWCRDRFNRRMGAAQGHKAFLETLGLFVQFLDSGAGGHFDDSNAAFMAANPRTFLK